MERFTTLILWKLGFSCSVEGISCKARSKRKLLIAVVGVALCSQRYGIYSLKMISLDWLFGQAAFIYAFNKIKPAVIVDKIIEAAVDILVPGKGAGESNWFWRNLRSLERDSDRISKELDIRAELRNWDREFPFFHHEMIVRYAAGFLASAVAVTAFGQIKALFSSSKRGRY